ncbi:cytochrome P450 [Gloeopeniophorella convolvens]|nr:cytochrome P450 [Gloeopeniophorella convolvens]
MAAQSPLSLLGSAWGSGSDHPVRTAAVTTLLGLIAWSLVQIVRKSLRTLPPGPKGLPFIGDIKHIADHNWLSSPERKDEYGGMMYISAFGQGILILNSQRVATDLLEKRSNIYSNRPHYISAGDYMSANLAFGFMPYNDLWRTFRRASLDSFSKSAAPRFYPTQTREALMLGLALMTSPSAMDKHFRRHASSIMLSINYHFPPVESEHDPVVAEVTDHAQRLLHELQPGTRLVEYLPWLRYVPSRFAKWKRDAEYWYNEDSLMYERLINKVADDLANGIDQPSLSATLIKNQSQHNLSERERAWLAGEMFAAGGETTSATLLWWLLTMIAHPDVQARAHAELDEVVGRARPPTFADLPSLPYVRAIVKETLRWRLVMPFGVPHVAAQDDWYDGAFIPAGTICCANVRMLNFDPAVFGADAALFDPARHLDGRVRLEGREEGHMTYGFGRRICVGRFVADGTLSIDFATLLWAMRFERPEGAQGELDIDTLVHSGVTTRPMPYDCKAVPRFPEAEMLLTEALELHK